MHALRVSAKIESTLASFTAHSRIPFLGPKAKPGIVFSKSFKSGRPSFGTQFMALICQKLCDFPSDKTIKCTAAWQAVGGGLILIYFVWAPFRLPLGGIFSDASYVSRRFVGPVWTSAMPRFSAIFPTGSP